MTQDKDIFASAAPKPVLLIPPWKGNIRNRGGSANGNKDKRLGRRKMLTCSPHVRNNCYVLGEQKKKKSLLVQPDYTAYQDCDAAGTHSSPQETHPPLTVRHHSLAVAAISHGRAIL